MRKVFIKNISVFFSLFFSCLFTLNAYAGGGLEKTLSGEPLSILEWVVGGGFFVYIIILMINHPRD